MKCSHCGTEYWSPKCPSCGASAGPAEPPAQEAPPSYFPEEPPPPPIDPGLIAPQNTPVTEASQPAAGLFGEAEAHNQPSANLFGEADAPKPISRPASPPAADTTRQWSPQTAQEVPLRPQANAGGTPSTRPLPPPAAQQPPKASEEPPNRPKKSGGGCLKIGLLMAGVLVVLALVLFLLFRALSGRVDDEVASALASRAQSLLPQSQSEISSEAPPSQAPPASQAPTPSEAQPASSSIPAEGDWGEIIEIEPAE